MKNWYQSKIVWVNVIGTLLAVAPLVGVYANVLSPETAVIVDATLAFVTGILNVVLRVWFTDTPVEH